MIARSLRAAIGLATALLYSAAHAGPPLPSWVTGGWTEAERRVSEVYLAALGRVPDPEGLNYWVFEVGGPNAMPTREQIYATIESRMNGANSLVAPMVEDNATLVRYIYSFLLGKAYEDDPSGVNFWTQQLNNGTYTRARMVDTLIGAAYGTTEPRSSAIFQNRMSALEAVVKAQRMAGSYPLTYQEMLALLRRVGDSADSYNQAMADLYTLTRLGGPRPTGPSFDQAYTSSSLWSAAWAYPGGNGAKVHRTIVWYNAVGDMMVANAYLPSNYSTGTNFPAIVTLHGGAWRNGFIEQINQHNIEFAKTHVVFSPAYRLTSLGYKAPAQENDVKDFMQLLRSKASAFKLNSSRIHLWGFSAGGHLATLVGQISNQGCVASASGPMDLRDASNLDILKPYIAHYVTAQNTKEAQSPRLKFPTSTSTTKFYLMYGTSDSVVSPTQYGGWTHPRVKKKSYAGQNHMLEGVLPTVYADSRYFFDALCHTAW